MFHRIIIATDLSSASDEIVANLEGLKALGVREAILAHAIEAPVSGTTTTTFNYGDLLKEDRSRRAAKAIDKQKETLEAQGFTTSVKLLGGTPSAEVSALAGTAKAGLIVAGSRGSSLARDLFIGSTALNILRASPVPVLLKRVQVQGASGRPHLRSVSRDLLRHVLFATDFSPSADRSMAVLAQLACRRFGKITLLHVESPDSTGGEIEEARALLEAIKSKLESEQPEDIFVRIARGNPAEEIVKMAEISDVSMAIMSTRGKGFVEEFFLGSVSQAVAREIHIPLLLVSPRAELANDDPKSLDPARREAAS